MKQLLIYTFCLFAFISVSQNSNTFFVKKLTNEEQAKLVLSEGDKLKVRYTRSDMQNKIKGKITEIGASYLIVDNERIELNQIDLVSAHTPGIKILGGILFSAGSGLIVAGLERKSNPLIIEKDDPLNFVNSDKKTVVRDGTGLIVLGTIICGISAVGIITPTLYPKDKYRFATNIAE